MQKIIKPVSGFLVLILSLAGIAASIYIIVQATGSGTTNGALLGTGIALLLISIFFSGGLIVINPNQSSVCTFFGKYVGTIKENGLLFVNPFYKKQKISLRSNNFESTKLKVAIRTSQSLKQQIIPSM
jgi:regulator of protease activity HflC (stomatin/prohibitin superfamily)